MPSYSPRVKNVLVYVALGVSLHQLFHSDSLLKGPRNKRLIKAEGSDFLLRALFKTCHVRKSDLFAVDLLESRAFACPQGHNQLVAYSRAAYFCIFCALIWFLEQLLRSKDLPVSTLYGVTIVCHDALHFIRDLLVGMDGSHWTHSLFSGCLCQALRNGLTVCETQQGSPTASRSPS